MKNWLKIILSMIFLFGVAIIGIIAIVILFDLNFLFIFVAFIVLDFSLALLIFFSNRRSEVKTSWIILITMIPMIGFISYVFFGRKYHYPKNKQMLYINLNQIEYEKYQRENDLIFTEKHHNFFRTMELVNKDVKKPVYHNNSVTILTNGTRVFKSLLEDLQKAQKYVLITYFIIADGELFDIFLTIIKERIAAGVQVYIIYDHVGSYFKISNKSIKKLINNGVKVKKYLPIVTPFISGNANYRNHRKNIIIDGLVGYTGGVNLADVYVDQSYKFGIFQDTQVRIEGEAVRGLEIIFVSDWYFASKGKENILESNVGVLLPKEYKTKGISYVQIVNHGPSVDHSITKDLYISLITRAEKRIWLATPYFIPPKELIEALLLAVRSGVDVRLTIPGLTDKNFVLDITKTYCRDLIANGVKVYEMNNIFTHSKIAIFDDNIAIVGSCNLDYRSFFSDHQTTAVIYDEQVVKDFIPQWEWDYRHSTLLKRWPIYYKSYKYRLLLSCLKLVAPIL